MVKGEKGGNWLFLGQRENEHGGSILYEGRRLVFIIELAGVEVGGGMGAQKGSGTGFNRAYPFFSLSRCLTPSFSSSAPVINLFTTKVGFLN